MRRAAANERVIIYDKRRAVCKLHALGIDPKLVHFPLAWKKATIYESARFAGRRFIRSAGRNTIRSDFPAKATLWIMFMTKSRGI